MTNLPFQRGTQYQPQFPYKSALPSTKLAETLQRTDGSITAVRFCAPLLAAVSAAADAAAADAAAATFAAIITFSEYVKAAVIAATASASPFAQDLARTCKEGAAK